MYGAIDRIENGIAVIEFDNGFQLELKAKYIKNAEEGKVIHFVIDEEETAKRTSEIKNLQDKLLRGDHLKKDEEK